MYISKIIITNFRALKALDLKFSKGLNLIAGENDSGKTALVDAIRIILGTKDFERYWISEDDFHLSIDGRAKHFKIECEITGFTDEEASHFIEWLCIRKVSDQSEYYLKLTFEAERKDEEELTSRFDRKIKCNLFAGSDDDGIKIEGTAKELLNTTYLKPLRDAEQELASRKGSRLSQIFFAHPEIKEEKENIERILNEANEQIRNNPKIKGQKDSINNDYLSQFIIGEEKIEADVAFSEPNLRNILESLKLILNDSEKYGSDEFTKHGLGLNNLLFIATELILLKSGPFSLPLLLIEEPEAHLHPQLQLRLANFLEQQSNSDNNIQVIMSTHSPNLASKVDIKNLIIMKNGQAYPLAPEYTELSSPDYMFLKNFLDVTKANLFFAKGIILVEGYAEQILLPVIAELIGKPLDKNGISIINVGNLGLFRYANIFKRKDGKDIGIKVACITDLDIPPDEAKDYLGDRKTKQEFLPNEIVKVKQNRINKVTGTSIKTFLAENWTLEYELALTDFAQELYLAIRLAKSVATDKDKRVIPEANAQFGEWKSIAGITDNKLASLIYQDLAEKKASKADTAQYFIQLLKAKVKKDGLETNQIEEKLPKYLIDAIKYVTSPLETSEGEESRELLGAGTASNN